MNGPRPSYAVRVSRPGARWRVELLAEDAGDELPALERALGTPGADGWPGPFVIVVDSGLYFVVLRHGPGGMIRALISDATMQEGPENGIFMQLLAAAVGGGRAI